MNNPDKLPPAILLMGPTATGKTEMALRLCDQFPCEIISVDSALVYRGMDIGTAKPSKETLAKYPHALVDILDPAESYSAALFRHDVLQTMAGITEKGRVPLLVGGTMLYFRALQQGLSQLPEADAETRVLLQGRLSEEGLPALHTELARIDPPSAARINSNDPQRILRALEIYLLSGEPMSQLLARHRNSGLEYRLLKLALWAEDRRGLHARIAERFTGMLSNGFVDEVTGLKSRGDLDLSRPSMRTVGYRQVWQYLDGEFDYEEMRERGIIATRQLAKRQMTWLRAEQDLYRIDFQDAASYPPVDVVLGFLDK